MYAKMAFRRKPFSCVGKQIHKFLKVLGADRPWDEMICGHIAQRKCCSNRVILPGGCVVIEHIRKDNTKTENMVFLLAHTNTDWAKVSGLNRTCKSCDGHAAMRLLDVPSNIFLINS
jgi:hypothetical protein